jgi:glutathione synthase/RimK-type ligase-like ATP-grasp enzyme
MKVAILTEQQYVSPIQTDWYIDQVLLEDDLLKKGIEKLGIACVKVDWANPDFDWKSVDAAIFRSTWDYFHRFDEFSAWIAKEAKSTRFINSIEQISWNMDKHYLLDLAKKDIPIVESIFIEKGNGLSLKELHEKNGFNKTVLKPCVSGGGRHTYLLDESNFQEFEEIFKDLIQTESMILQPFQEQIVTKGEVSHIVIGGKHTHSILKKAKSGDYRVQDDFGGTVHDYKASQEEIAFAEKVAQACEPLPLFARVDVIWDNNDQLVISEVELIEPELWFRKNPEAADLLAAEIKKTLD